MMRWLLRAGVGHNTAHPGGVLWSMWWLMRRCVRGHAGVGHNTAHPGGVLRDMRAANLRNGRCGHAGVGHNTAHPGGVLRDMCAANLRMRSGLRPLRAHGQRTPRNRWGLRC